MWSWWLIELNGPRALCLLLEDSLLTLRLRPFKTGGQLHTLENKNAQETKGRVIQQGQEFNKSSVQQSEIKTKCMLWRERNAK